jgi:hypothetical protein
MGQIRNTYKILVRKCDGKKPLGRCKCRLEDNIKMDLRETGWESTDWVHLVQDKDQWQALVNMVMDFWNSISTCATISFSRRTLLHTVSQLCRKHEENEKCI